MGNGTYGAGKGSIRERSILKRMNKSSDSSNKKYDDLMERARQMKKEREKREAEAKLKNNNN